MTSAAGAAPSHVPAPAVALRLLREHFFNRTDQVAALLEWEDRRSKEKKSIPSPVRAAGRPNPEEALDALLVAHLLGPKAPRAKIAYRNRQGDAVESGRFRLGSYAPGLDGTTKWICLDFDGAGHSAPLANPEKAARDAAGAFSAAGLAVHLERSKSCKGWHLWCLFSVPIAADKARDLGRMMAPKDAPLATGGVADPLSNRGIEIFPKQSRVHSGEHGKRGSGNMVWLPWYYGAAEGGNVFYREGATGELQPYTPEDLATVTPEQVDAALAAAAPPPPESAVPRNAGHPDLGDLDAAFAEAEATRSPNKEEHEDWKRRALSSVPLERVFGEWLTGKDNGDGWLQCRDPWSESGDRNPSAGVATGRGSAERGTFHSFRTGKSYDLFDFMVERGIAADFVEARDLVAEWSGVPVPLRSPVPSPAAAPPGPAASAAAPATGTAPVVPDTKSLAAFELTDSGNAERLVHFHGQNLRFVDERWLVWDGTRWVPSSPNDVLTLTLGVVRSIEPDAYIHKAMTPEEIDERRKLVEGFKKTCEGVSRRQAIVTLGASQPQVKAKRELFDANPWVLNVLNGTLNLREVRFNPVHRREDLITRVAPVRYDEKAKARKWEAFLCDVQPSAAVRQYLQRLAGYCLTGVIREQVFVVFHGLGRNGKGVWVRTMSRLLGSVHRGGFSSNIQAAMLMERQFEPHEAEYTRLLGARMAFAVEPKSNQKIDTAQVKKLTGGDDIPAAFKFKDPFEFSPTHKLIFVTNPRPRFDEVLTSMRARLHMVPWEVTAAGRENPDLELELAEELPGILNWAIDGLQSWMEKGLCPPDEVLAATEDLFGEIDHLGDFLESCCTVDSKARVPFKDLFDVYVAWAQRADQSALTKHAFGGALSERGFHLRKVGDVRYRAGLALRKSASSASTRSAADYRSDPDIDKDD